MNYAKILNSALDRAGLPKMFSVKKSGKGYFKAFECVSQSKNGFIFENGELRLEASFEEAKNGVVIRKDSVTNISDKSIVLNELSSVFEFEGGEYDVYTQYNCWQREGESRWTPLHTQVVSESFGIRTCDGAAPVMALSNRQNGRTVVFHLVPNCQWKMKAVRSPMFCEKYDVVRLSAGFSDNALELELESGKTVDLPEVIFFNAQNKTDLDAYKLHDVWNTLYPRRKMPVMYNNWFLKFDQIDVEDVMRQAKAAAEMGIEMFLIDAGWFGTVENWGECIGDWRENTVGGFKGRVKEVSDYVRSLGMTFGMWIEPERALKTTPVNKEHPEYFIGDMFLDFSNPDARDYITEITCSLIEKYNVGFLKFDFNETIPYDPKKCGFYHYYNGQQMFVEEIRRRFPDIYITCCASGGYRIDLGHAKIFDSFWISDNQGPIEGIDIFAGEIVRMMPAAIEKWAVQTFCENIPLYQSKELRTMPISCDGATWDDMLYVKENYTLGFLSATPSGFTGNIADFPESYKQTLKNFFENYKRSRDFYITANARLLCKTDKLTVIQYSSKSLDRIAIYCYTKLVRQAKVTVYPAVDASKNYRLGDEVISGAELLENGIVFTPLFDHECLVKELEAV